MVAHLNQGYVLVGMEPILLDQPTCIIHKSLALVRTICTLYSANLLVGSASGIPFIEEVEDAKDSSGPKVHKI